MDNWKILVKLEFDLQYQNETNGSLTIICHKPHEQQFTQWKLR